jgi:hypothetical protein
VDTAGLENGEITTAVGAVVVPARFVGPPGSANGGWIAGTLAGYLDAPAAGTAWAAEAVLRARTPLQVPLSIEAADGAGVRLTHDGTVLVEAYPAAPAEPAQAPPFVEHAAAEQAAAAALRTAAHPFSMCFGCGTGRAPGDGLRLLPGPVPDGPPGLVAVPWTIDASLAGPEGTIGRHLLWSALDCPSFWAHQAALPGEELIALLARQTVTLADAAAADTVTPGTTYIVVARADAAEGRKLHASSALYDQTGHLVAAATALWIRLPAVDHQ